MLPLAQIGHKLHCEITNILTEITIFTFDIPKSQLEKASANGLNKAQFHATPALRNTK